MIRNQINKQHRSKYFVAFIVVLAMVMSLIPMYVFADAGNDIKYVRIKSSWKPTQYLYEKNGRVVYGSPAVDDPTSHWVLEDFNGAKRIKNRATGHYINISGHRKKGEGDYWNDPVRCSEWKDDSNSFLWMLIDQGTGMNITSVANNTFNIHVEDQNGSAQCSDVPANWASPQWLFEPASQTVSEVKPDQGPKEDSNDAGSQSSNPAPSIGGDVAFIYGAPGSGAPITDQTFIPWVEMNTYFNKSLGERSSAYLRLRLSVYNGHSAPNVGFAPVVGIPSLGYSYSINDGLSFSALVDGDGDVLADTQVLNDGYNWYYTFSNGNSMNMHNSVFANRTEIKMNATVLPGLNLALAYAPTNGTKPEQYLAKFKYTGQGFNISGGYTNTANGYGDYYADRPTYALSGTVTAIPNINLYGEYMEKGYYLIKANAQWNPFTLKVTNGNVGYSRLANPVYLANTVDCELNYAVSSQLKIIGGIAYSLNTDHDGLSLITAGFAKGPLTLLAQHNYNAVFLPLSEPDGGSYPNRVNPATLVPNTTRLVCQYNLEGSSSLGAEYNLEKGIWFIMLHVGL